MMKLTMRGEVTIDLGSRRVCGVLTLRALADIEQRLGLQSFAELLTRGSRDGLTARELQTVIMCAIRAGGTSMPEETLSCEVGALSAAQGSELVAALIQEAFSVPEQPLASDQSLAIAEE